MIESLGCFKGGDTMQAQEIANLISSCGFPIVACGFLAYYISNALKDLQKRTEENTQAINKLITLVETIIRKEVDDK